jgi:hypothetical protein
MLAFRPRRTLPKDSTRPESAEHKLAYGVDHRTKRVKKTFQFTDIFRSGDVQPEPSPQFQKAFGQQMAHPRRLATVPTRMDPSFPSASGARLTLLL